MYFFNFQLLSICQHQHNLHWHPKFFMSLYMEVLLRVHMLLVLGLGYAIGWEYDRCLGLWKRNIPYRLNWESEAKWGGEGVLSLALPWQQLGWVYIYYWIWILTRVHVSFIPERIGEDGRITQDTVPEVMPSEFDLGTSTLGSNSDLGTSVVRFCYPRETTTNFHFQLSSNLNVMS